MNNGVNIAKNTSYLTLALILQKIISFTYFTLLARYLGPADLGKYYLAISFTSLLAVFIDLGLANVLIREVAKDQKRASTWLGNVLGIKILLSFVAILILLVLTKVLTLDPVVRSLIYISAISMVLDSFTASFFALIRGFHNLKYESISSIIFQLIVLVLGYGALMAGWGLIWAMAALAFASFYNFIFSALIIKYRLKLAIKIIFDKQIIKKILNITWPFALYAILQTTYLRLDSIFLAIFANSTQVGLYQIAFKVVLALQFLPLAFNASLYPAFSVYWHTKNKQLNITFERALNYLTIISWPIVIGVLVLAPKFVLLFKSDYQGAILPLRISIIALFFIFINYPLGALLNACDAQRLNTKNMALVTLSSIILNILLIPHWQAVGASLTVLITNFLMFILGFYYVKKIIKYQWKKNLIVFLKVFLASLIMGLFIFWGQKYLNIFIISLLGAVLYFLILFLFKAIQREDLISIYKSLKKKNELVDKLNLNL